MNRYFLQPNLLLRALLVFILTTGGLLSAPYGPEGRSIEWKQPDGTKLSLRVLGDEFYGRTETADGYTAIFDPATKTYHYATLTPDGNDLAATGKPVGKVDPKTLGLAKGLKINPAAKAAKARKNAAAFEAVVKQGERWEAVKAANRNYRSFKSEVRKKEKNGKKGFAIPLGTIFPDSEVPPAPQMASPKGESTGETGPEMGPPSFTLTGDVVGLTILVDFSDDPGTAVTQPQVDDYFNKPNYTGFGNSGSIYDYFFIQSGGRLRYSNNVTYYVRVPQPKTYYDDTSVDSGLCGRLLLNDALDVLIADGYDFSTLTTKSGGNVRACNIFFAGDDSGVWAKGLWPHRWVLSPSKSVGAGMQIYDYQITNIGTASTLKIGTVCHENGHMLLGYPDLYSYDGNASNVGKFSLMAGGSYGGSGYHPTNIDPYLKTASGWADIVELDSTSSQRCTVQVDNNLFYRYLNPSEPREYFMFEVRDNTGYEGPYGGHSRSVNPSTGLLAYHLREHGTNTRSTIFTADSPNADYTKPYELLVLEANPSAAQTPWYDNPTPGTYDAFKSSDKNQISDATTPSLKFWNASGRGTNSGGIVHSISSDSSVMTFIAGAGSPSGSPSISLSRSNIYGYSDFGALAPSQTFSICNGQGGTLNYSVTDNQTWLSCTLVSGSVDTGSNTITVNFDSSGLSAGTYTGTITVTDPGASPTSKTITVTLVIAVQPVMALTSASISEIGITGTVGPQASFGVSNTGGGAMNYIVSKTQSWLSISPSSGTVVGETDTIYVNFDATSLSPGTYNDTITVTSAQANNSPLTIPVSFTVKSTDMILISPTGGETWFLNTTQDITWASSLGGNVKIELLKGGALNTTLAATTANDGSFSWTVPGGQTLGSDYKIRVTSLEPGAKSDESTTNFTIAEDLLAAALDTTGISWSTSGKAEWFRQTTTTHDSSDAAESGNITDSQSSSMETTLIGPGTMTFWWQVSSESGWDFLEFYINNTIQTGALAKISGNVNWVQKTVTIPAGSNVVKWTYRKDWDVDGGTDNAWVDQVVFTPEGNYVTYNGNGHDGGAVPVDSTAYSDGATVTVLSNSGNLTQTGYTFTGWNTQANGSGTAYSSGNTFSINTATTLHAQWNAVPIYTVSYQANGATSGTPPSNQTKTDGVNLTLATNSGNLVKTGYTFTGWNTATDGSGNPYAAGASYSANSAVTLYAQWAITTYTISYNGNSNTGGSTPSNQTKTHGVNLTLSGVGSLVKAGHSFGGWNTAADGSGSPYSSGGTYSTNAATTLYAQWTPETYTVSYDGNGNTSGAAPPNQVKTYDQPLTLASNTGGLVKTSYIFTGWNTQTDGNGTDYAGGASYTNNAATSLYAKWVLSSPPVITLLDPADGATGVAIASNLTVTFDENIAIGTGNITLKNLTDLSQTVIDITDGAQVSVSGTILTINPTNDLLVGKNYAVQLDAGAVTDLIGSPFAGITDDTTWNFQSVIQITIFTESFENPNVIDDGSTDPTGWNTVQHPGYVHISDENDTSKNFTSTPDGEQALTCYLGGGAHATTSASILSDTVTVGSTYTLSFHVAAVPTRSNASYTATLLAIDGVGGETVLGTIVGNNDGSSDMSYTDNLEVTPTANAGERLAIRLQHTPGSAWQDQPTFDNVQLMISGGTPSSTVDHFAISTITGTQTVGTPITGITITAQDVANATVTGFTGTVNFAGTAGVTGTSASFLNGILTGVSVTPTVVGSNLTLVVDDGSSHTGSATFTVLSKFESWAGGGTTFTADTNNDGVSDGVAWLLGATQPATNAQDLLPAGNSADGADLVMTFNCLNAVSRGSSVLSIQYSQDLGVADLWTNNTVVIPETSSTVSGVVFVINANGNVNEVQATIPAAASSLFGRVSGSLAP